MQRENLGRTAVLAMAAAALTFTYAASAADIGFVVNTGNDPNPLEDPFDAGWVARLGTQGHTVTLFNQGDGANPAVDSMDLFIVSQDVASSTAWSNFGNKPKPILTYEYGIFDNIFATVVSTANEGNSPSLLANGMSISDSLHPLAAGLSGNVSLYTGTPSTVGFLPVLEKSSGTQVIGVSADVPANGLFLLLEAGAIGGDNQTWTALRMALPCYDNWDPALVTTDGWKLLDGAVAYAVVPEPGSLALLGLGTLVLILRRQRRLRPRQPQS